MPASILVTYATRYGSTQEVAEAVADGLGASGLAVTVQPMPRVRALDGYHAVVLGAPLYIGRWHQDAQTFLSQHQQALTRRPVAVFALGPIAGHTDEEWQGAREMLDQEVARYPWLKPVAIELFGGKYDPARLGFLHRLLAMLPASPLHGAPASDLRDWEAIRAWAGSLAPRLPARPDV